MEIIVLVLGIVGFVLSPIIVGGYIAAAAVVFGMLRLMLKKKPLRKLGRVEIKIGIVFAILAIIVSAYVYYAGIKGIDFINIINGWINSITGFFKRIF